MNRKERYFAAVAHRDVDRIPTSFRTSRVFTRRLMAHFGIDPSTGIVAARATLDRLGADFWASGSRVGYYSTFVPRYTGPRPQAPYTEDGSYFYTLGIPARRGSVDEYGFEYPAYCEPPLAAAQRAGDIRPGFLTEKLALFDFNCMVNKQAPAADEAATLAAAALSYESLRRGGQDVICIGILNNFFMICCYLRGMEQFLLDLAWDRPLVERLVGEVGEFCLEFNRRQLATFGDKAECCAGWDDVAGQQGILFSPRLFRQYFLPLYEKLIAQVKCYNLLFSWHCCGSVHDVLPAMIEAGIDIFDVVQTSARNMDLETMYRRYGRAVALHGGIDVQKLLVFGNPAQVRAEVGRARDLWGTRGGIILGPAHEIVPETPIENVLAIYE